ncbi:hypothetical protein GLOIN_2v1488499 [Rhizophagus irregularis DAOM 181602=DAOM 197198]|nr:hypothetical protein GLOIN_2v1488499 [Rhizophagus irregularis DAOM 181602=DAOM 197198]
MIMLSKYTKNIHIFLISIYDPTLKVESTLSANDNPIIKNFLKIGLLVRDVYSTQPKFTTPILLIILSHHMISSNLKSLQRDLTRQDFNKFLIRSIELAVSVVLLGASISANVGYVFGSDGYLDYYINGEICWGIELT